LHRAEHFDDADHHQPGEVNSGAEDNGGGGGVVGGGGGDMAFRSKKKKKITKKELKEREVRRRLRHIDW